MNQATRKLIIVTRATRLEEVMRRYNTRDQAKFYLERQGANFVDLEDEHDRYQAVVQSVESDLSTQGRTIRVERHFLPNFLFPSDAPVVVIGQDGLIANTLKYVGQATVIGVNPDPGRWTGRLHTCTAADANDAVTDVLKGHASTKKVSMAQVQLSDGQQLLAVNDFFIGARTHVSARYSISYREVSESQSSSGVIVSTGLGSTGWLRGVLTGAAGIAGQVKGRAKVLCESGLSWDSPTLIYSVREPFPSPTTATQIVFGTIGSGETLSITSYMGEGGVVFSDGIEADALEFNAGITARIALASHVGHLVH